MKKLAIACDHAGFEYKEYLKNKEVEGNDMGKHEWGEGENRKR